jgi:NAD-dependent oxidoreductase involved in siderophore biosynthesis
VQEAGVGAAHFAAPGGAGEDHLTVPSVQVFGPAEAPSYRTIFDTIWPAGVGHALDGLHQAVRAGEKPLRRGQYHLALCQMWQEITARLGPPQLVHEPSPHPLTPADVSALAAAGAVV